MERLNGLARPLNGLLPLLAPVAEVEIAKGDAAESLTALDGAGGLWLDFLELSEAFEEFAKLSEYMLPTQIGKIRRRCTVGGKKKEARKQPNEQTQPSFLSRLS